MIVFCILGLCSPKQFLLTLILKYITRTFSTDNTMENSFGLGFIHGAVYGLVPITPWFITIKHYILDGRKKGLLSAAGTVTGQFIILAMSLLGWKELLWLWYYLEPALVMWGFAIALRTFMECVRIPTLVGMGSKSGEIKSSTEAYVHFLGAFALMFCNPSHLDGSQLLLVTTPNNIAAYLFSSIVTSTFLSFGLWFLLGSRIFGTVCNYGARLEDTVTYNKISRVALAIAAGVLSQIFTSTIEPLSTYHVENLTAYTPFDSIKSEYARGWAWEADEEDGKSDKESDVPKEKKTPPTTNTGQIQFGENSEPLELDLSTNSGHNIIAQLIRAWTERTTEMPITTQEQHDQLQWTYFSGFNRGAQLNRIRFMHFLLTPKWEYQEDKKYIQTLKEIRQELDTQIQEESNVSIRRAIMPYTPHFEFETDYEHDEDLVRKMFILNIEEIVQMRDAEREEEKEEELVDEKFSLRDLNAKQDDLLAQLKSFETSFEGRHTAYMDDAELSYAKLHRLPTEARLPWHYPFVEVNSTFNTFDPIINRFPNEIDALNTKSQWIARNFMWKWDEPYYGPDGYNPLLFLELPNPYMRFNRFLRFQQDVENLTPLTDSGYLSRQAATQEWNDEFRIRQRELAELRRLAAEAAEEAEKESDSSLNRPPRK